MAGSWSGGGAPDHERVLLLLDAGVFASEKGVFASEKGVLASEMIVLLLPRGEVREGMFVLETRVLLLARVPVGEGRVCVRDRGSVGTACSRQRRACLR